MSKEEYMRYTEARKASFTYKKAKKVFPVGFTGYLSLFGSDS